MKMDYFGNSPFLYLVSHGRIIARFFFFLVCGKTIGISSSRKQTLQCEMYPNALLLMVCVFFLIGCLGRYLTYNDVHTSSQLMLEPQLKHTS